MKELNFERIGKKIKEVRLEKKLTQEYIADIVDVNTSHISNIENNRVKVSLSTRGRKIFCVYGKNSSLIRNRYV